MGDVIQREVKFVTTQRVLDDKPLVDGIYPMREWSVTVLNPDDTPPAFLEKVVFKLHESFANPNKTIKRAPWKVVEQGWGEFEMGVVLHYIDNSGSATFTHDLNFQSGETYSKPQTVTFKNAKPGLLKALGKRGTETEGSTGTTGKKAKRQKRVVDVDRLADGLQTLHEDELLQIVQIVNDGKTDEMYVRNDLEEGEFHIDLHTLSDGLLLEMQRFVDSVKR